MASPHRILILLCLFRVLLTDTDLVFLLCAPPLQPLASASASSLSMMTYRRRLLAMAMAPEGRRQEAHQEVGAVKHIGQLPRLRDVLVLVPARENGERKGNWYCRRWKGTTKMWSGRVLKLDLTGNRKNAGVSVMVRSPRLMSD